MLYRNSPLPWYVEAKHAKAHHGMDEINFWENVTIHHAADAQHPATLIKTESLFVKPNEQTALTKDFVTLTQPNLIVKATGLQADMNTGDIKLLSEARGEYVPS
jgi:lipopolysaccharide export system protein LptC